jgi:hypothetical protein
VEVLEIRPARSVRALPPGVDCQGTDDVLLRGKPEHLDRGVVGSCNSAVIVVGDQGAGKIIESGERRRDDAVVHDREPDLRVDDVKRLVKVHRTLQA